MTKKHFEAMAKDIKNANQTRDTKYFAALVVIHTAMQDNPRFDQGRFLKACGLEQGAQA